MSVAALDEGQWHRVEVLCVSGQHVFALFLDSGIMKYIKKSNLRYLEKTFASLSRKACKGRLHGVKPKDGRPMWGLEEARFLISKEKDQKLMALVKDVDESHVFSLSLIEADEECTAKHLEIASTMISKEIVDAAEDESKMNAFLV
jgi:Tudor domain